MLYRSETDLTGPLFLKVNKQGAVTAEPVVSATHLCLLPNHSPVVSRPTAYSAVHSSLACRTWGTSLGHCMVPTLSAVVDVSTGSGTKTGLLPW